MLSNFVTCMHVYIYIGFICICNLINFFEEADTVMAITIRVITVFTLFFLKYRPIHTVLLLLLNCSVLTDNGGRVFLGLGELYMWGREEGYGRPWTNTQPRPITKQRWWAYCSLKGQSFNSSYSLCFMWSFLHNGAYTRRVVRWKT